MTNSAAKVRQDYEKALREHVVYGFNSNRSQETRDALDAAVLALIERGIEIGAEELGPMLDEPSRTHQEDVALWHRVAESLLKSEELEKP